MLLNAIVAQKRYRQTSKKTTHVKYQSKFLVTELSPTIRSMRYHKCTIKITALTFSFFCWPPKIKRKKKKRLFCCKPQVVKKKHNLKNLIDLCDQIDQSMWYFWLGSVYTPILSHGRTASRPTVSFGQQWFSILKGLFESLK